MLGLMETKTANMVFPSPSVPLSRPSSSTLRVHSPYKRPLKDRCRNNDKHGEQIVVTFRCFRGCRIFNSSRNSVYFHISYGFLLCSNVTSNRTGNYEFNQLSQFYLASLSIHFVDYFIFPRIFITCFKKISFLFKKLEAFFIYYYC